MYSVNGPIGPEKYGLRSIYFKSTRSFLLIIIMFNNGVYSYNVNLNYDWRLRLGLEAGYGSKTSILQAFIRRSN
jgi:hypothetical protein